MSQPEDTRIGALQHPLDEFRRELQQSVLRLNGMADEVAGIIKKLDEEIARLKGYHDTIQNLEQRAQLR